MRRHIPRGRTPSLPTLQGYQTDQLLLLGMPVDPLGNLFDASEFLGADQLAVVLLPPLFSRLVAQATLPGVGEDRRKLVLQRQRTEQLPLSVVEPRGIAAGAHIDLVGLFIGCPGFQHH